ncbi:serine-threonine/tyrosine-protein kinase catalytic domain-containing protein, partial [Tanacetum coccineum]
YEKVRRLFQRFDVNRDGVLNKEELANFFIVTNPQVKFTEDEISSKIDSFFHWYGDGKKGLTCNGMLRSYSHGVDNLNSHFEMLRLTFRNEVPLQTTERYEKARRIFQQFDVNRDGCLDMLELYTLLMICNPDQDEEQLKNNAINVLCLYGEFIDGEGGINCDGLFKFYDSGIDSLDDDFEKLNLKLKPLEDYELALRYEKVRRIFQRFDINEDGCLNKEELTELVFTTEPDLKNAENKELASSILDYILSYLTEFTNGEKGLTFDGLRHTYDHLGDVDELDDDFKKLRLDLKPLDDMEDALRKSERAEKVRIMFERFDTNRDGGLDKWELGILLFKKNPQNEALEEVHSDVDKVFRWYAKYIDGDRGLTCDGLLRTYDHGIDSLDVDFETLGLELRTSTESEDASRKKDR